MDTVVGLFERYGDADQAVQALEHYGVAKTNISIVTRDNDTFHGTSATVPAAATGAVAGGLVGIIAGVSALLIPGFGPVIATGTIASTLASTLGITAIGVGVGAATGGLLGALVDLGFSHKDAEFYAEGVNRGGILVSVTADDKDEERIREILRGAGAVNMNTDSETWQRESAVGPEETERFNEEADRY